MAEPKVNARVTTYAATEPLRSRFHPGWIVLAAGAIGVFMTTPGQTVGVSPFIDLLAPDLGLSRSRVVMLYSLGTLLGILPAPLVGRLVDRYGPRHAIPIVALAVAGGCAVVGLAHGSWSLAVAFTLLRGSAIGGLNLVSLNMVNLWFERLRGRATAIAMMGLAAGGLVIPGLSAHIAASYGWRVAYFALGAAVLAVMLPVGLMFFRNGPQSYGALPDFGRIPKGDQTHTSHDRTLGEAIRTPAFWYLVLLSILANAVGTALLLDHVRVLTVAGLSRFDAISLLGAVTVAQGLGTLGGGWLIDWFGARRVGLVGITLLILSVVCVMTTPSLMGGFAYSVALGGAIGLLQVSQSAGLAEYFGTRHLGTIRGTTFFIGIAGAAAGPLPFAWSPTAAYWIFLVSAAAAMGLGGTFVSTVPRRLTYIEDPPEPKGSVKP